MRGDLGEAIWWLLSLATDDLESRTKQNPPIFYSWLKKMEAKNYKMCSERIEKSSSNNFCKAMEFNTIRSWGGSQKARSNNSINRTIRQVAKKLMPTVVTNLSKQVSIRQQMKEHNKLAIKLREAGNFRSAIEHYEKAIRAVHELHSDPNHGKVLNIRERIADVYSLDGRYEDAMMMYSSVKDCHFKVHVSKFL